MTLLPAGVYSFVTLKVDDLLLVIVHTYIHHEFISIIQYNIISLINKQYDAKVTSIYGLQGYTSKINHSHPPHPQKIFKN